MFVKLTQKHSFIVHRLKKKQRNWIINNKYGRMDCKLYFSSKSGKKTKKRGWKKNKEKRSMSSRWCEFSQISRVSRGSRRIWCRSEDALGGGGDRVRKRLPLGLPSTWNSATINASGGCCPPPPYPRLPQQLSSLFILLLSFVHRQNRFSILISFSSFPLSHHLDLREKKTSKLWCLRKDHFTTNFETCSFTC